jgi:exosome complex component RRP45
MVVDPTFLEEQVKEGDMTITLNVHKEVCALSKAGGIPMEIDQILQCTKIAVVKVAEITAQIQAALESDAKKR